MAEKLKAAIMCDGGNDAGRRRLDTAICDALRRFGSLVNYKYRKSVPTFQGMSELFGQMQERAPQAAIRKMKREGETVSSRIHHFQVWRGEKEVRFSRIKGCDSSSRQAWPNYRRSLFTLACAFDRCEIVRALVVEFSCELDHETNIEDGLTLIDENGREREWHMTGFDLSIEFGCLATFEVLCALEHAHPGVAAAVEYAGLTHETCRALCKHHSKNKLESHFDASGTAEALELFASGQRQSLHDCKCAFCTHG